MSGEGVRGISGEKAMRRCLRKEAQTCGKRFMCPPPTSPPETAAHGAQVQEPRRWSPAGRALRAPRFERVFCLT